jgi:hypothetical protein
MLHNFDHILAGVHDAATRRVADLRLDPRARRRAAPAHLPSATATASCASVTATCIAATSPWWTASR